MHKNEKARERDERSQALQTAEIYATSLAQPLQISPTIAIADLLERVTAQRQAAGAPVPRTITHCLFRLRQEAEFQSRFPTYREAAI